MADRDPNQPLDDVGEVSVEQGLILIDGPGGLVLTLTPDAARTLGERLIAAAESAVP